MTNTPPRYLPRATLALPLLPLLRGHLVAMAFGVVIRCEVHPGLGSILALA